MAANAALLLLWPATVSAHAKLDAQTPRDGATQRRSPSC